MKKVGTRAVPTFLPAAAASSAALRPCMGITCPSKGISVATVQVVLWPAVGVEQALAHDLGKGVHRGWAQRVQPVLPGGLAPPMSRSRASRRVLSFAARLHRRDRAGFNGPVKRAALRHRRAEAFLPRHAAMFGATALGTVCRSGAWTPIRCSHDAHPARQR